MKQLSAKGGLEQELTKEREAHTKSVVMWNLQLEESQRLRKELKTVEERMAEELKSAVEEAEKTAEEKWKAWAEKESQVKAGKAVAAERKKWQNKGKALPVEKVHQLTQTDCPVEESKVEVVEMATQKREMRRAQNT